MRNKIFAFLFFIIILSIFSCNKDPYAEGSHWDYSILCEDGFKYKCLSNGRGTILILNSDGTPLRCDQIKY